MSRARKPDSEKVETYHITLHPRYRERVKSLDNFSAFVAIALDQFIGILVWDDLHKLDPEKYPLNENADPVPLVERFNQRHPKGERMKGTWPKPSVTPPELW